jgi:DNA-binding transcriptional ArsR family regulator
MTYNSFVSALPVDSVIRTLSDPTRRAIFERIVTSREATVRSLTEHARVSQPAVSQHLKVLQGARLISGRRDGRNTYYRANPAGLRPLEEWMNQYRRFWEESLDRLGDYVKEVSI